MSDDRLERERAALLAEIVPGQPLTEDQKRRVVEVSAADLDRAARDQSIGGRIGRDLAAQVAELFATSGVTDAEPGSATGQATDDGTGTEFYVVSRSRGRILIGTLPYLVVQARAGVIAVPYAEALEAKRAAPNEARARQKAEHIRRAVELQGAGHSVNRITQIMSAEGAFRGDKDPGRTVDRWLAAARSGTYHERSSS